MSWLEPVELEHRRHIGVAGSGRMGYDGKGYGENPKASQRQDGDELGPMWPQSSGSVDEKVLHVGNVAQSKEPRIQHDRKHALFCLKNFERELHKRASYLLEI